MGYLPVEETEILDIIHTLEYTQHVDQINLEEIVAKVKAANPAKVRNFLLNLESEGFIKIAAKTLGGLIDISLTMDGKKYVRSGHKLPQSAEIIINQEKCVNAINGSVSNIVIGDNISIENSFNDLLEVVETSKSITEKEEIKKLLIEIKEELTKDSFNKSKINFCINKIKKLGAGVVVNGISTIILKSLGF